MDFIKKLAISFTLTLFVWVALAMVIAAVVGIIYLMAQWPLSLLLVPFLIIFCVHWADVHKEFHFDLMEDIK